MTNVALLAGGIVSEVPSNFDVYVGVDRGALRLLKQNLPLDLAVGDFDSVIAEELTFIRKEARSIYESTSIKDDTDMELALELVFDKFPDAKVTIFGALGGRMDHALANIFLPSNPSISSYMHRIWLVDDCNLITYVAAGEHEISAMRGYDYIGFLSSENQHLIIRNAKYPLTEKNFFSKQVYASNEFIDKPIILSFETGYVVVVYSKDRG